MRGKHMFGFSRALAETRARPVYEISGTAVVGRCLEGVTTGKSCRTSELVSELSWKLSSTMYTRNTGRESVVVN